MKHFIILALLMLSACIQPDPADTKAQYSIFVQDKSDNSQLYGVRIFMKSANLEYDTLITDSSGHAESRFMSGQQVQMIATKSGYASLDTLDLIKQDTNTDISLKVMRLRMQKLSSSSLSSSSSSNLSGF